MSAASWYASARRDFIARAKMGLGLAIGATAIPIAWLASHASLLASAAALIPLALGIHKYLTAAHHFSPRYTKAGGNARWGTLNDASVKKLLPQSSDKPQSLSKSRRNIYWGMLGSTPLFYSGVKHGLLTGPPRCGKDSGIFMQNIFHLDDWSLVVVDPKGELTATTSRYRATRGDVVIMNPFGMHGIRSDGFNPLVTPSFVENPFECGVSIAQACVPIGDTREAIFPEGGQELLQCLILHAALDAAKAKGVPSLAVVNEFLRMPFDSEDAKAATLLKVMKQLTTHPHGELRRLAGQFTQNGRDIRSFVSSARIPLRFLNNQILLADLSRHPTINGKPFDFRMMKDRVTTVYVILPDDKLKKYDFWLRIVVGCALESLNAGVPGKVRQLIMINEAGNLGRLEALQSAMVMGAEKLTVLTAWQHLSQIKDLYGPEKVHSFLAGAGFFGSFGAAGDEYTAGYISRRAGSRTVPEKRFGLNETSAKSVSEGGVSYPLIHPSQIMSLSDRKLISWIEPAQEFPLMLHAPRSRRGDPNPYYAKP
jgi:type IV secretion system protein VirD4